MRRASHEALTKVAVQHYHPLQTKEATILVSALLENPENREQHVKRAATSTIMSVLYDYPTLASAEDKAVRDMEKSSHWVAQLAVWFFLAQLFPWIMHIPQRSTLYLRFNNAFTSYPIRFFKWKREASKHTAERSVMYLRLFNRVKTDLVHPSMTLWASGVNWIRRLGEWPGYPSN